MPEALDVYSQPRVLRADDGLVLGGSVEVSGNELRRLLGYSELKSTRFSFTAVGDSLVFTGEGYGHGVGLCQWGSRGMAAAEYGYKEILNYYYPGAGIAQWSAIAPMSLGEYDRRFAPHP